MAGCFSKSYTNDKGLDKSLCANTGNIPLKFTRIQTSRLSRNGSLISGDSLQMVLQSKYNKNRIRCLGNSNPQLLSLEAHTLPGELFHVQLVLVTLLSLLGSNSHSPPFRYLAKLEHSYKLRLWCIYFQFFYIFSTGHMLSWIKTSHGTFFSLYILFF